jgi:hypothetical protein
VQTDVRKYRFLVTNFYQSFASILQPLDISTNTFAQLLKTSGGNGGGGGFWGTSADVRIVILLMAAYYTYKKVRVPYISISPNPVRSLFMHGSVVPSLVGQI